MEANFSLESDGQLPAFCGLVSRIRLMNVFRVDGDDFWRAVRLLFGKEFLTQDWRSRTNLVILSLFTALALQVGKSVEEVQRITSLVLRPKWAGGLQEVVARPVIGEGLKMAAGPSRRIGVAVGEL